MNSRKCVKVGLSSLAVPAKVLLIGIPVLHTLWQFRTLRQIVSTDVSSTQVLRDAAEGRNRNDTEGDAFKLPFTRPPHEGGKAPLFFGTEILTDLCPRRQSVLKRSKIWLDDNVTYEFKHFHEGYRTQCSGFVSWAWGIPNPDPHDTPRCYNLEKRGLAKVIGKDDMRPGDAMVCNVRKYPLKGADKPNRKRGEQAGGHCLIFEQWVNEAKTSYIGWELCSDATCKGMTRRIIPYPYYYKKSCWEPMRHLNITC
mmetsp:Transcript_10664/g.19561  ORF Transcript_10664/g.19561 Transcript_10664/m.19561 type:complete len:254 (+) Transcript_10664:80-841(+)